MCKSHSNFRQFFSVIFFLLVDGRISRSTMSSEFTFASLFCSQEFVKRFMGKR